MLVPADARAGDALGGEALQAGGEAPPRRSCSGSGARRLGADAGDQSSGRFGQVSVGLSFCSAGMCWRVRRIAADSSRR